MAFKLNISEPTTSKTWKLETDSEALVGKKISEIIQGKEISADLEGYELKITGASDSSGFPHSPSIEGPEKRRIILTKGFGMHKKPRKEGKKKVQTPQGLRLKKSVRGNQLSEKTAQINLKISKPGKKPLAEIFPEQNKPKEQPKEEAKTKSPAQTSEQIPQQTETQSETPQEIPVPAQ